MSLLYRAIWKDCTDESDQRAVVELAHESFSRWALDDPDATPIGPGETVVRDKVLHLRVLDSDDMYGIEAQSRVSQGSAVWSVTLRALATGGVVHMWVDLGMETDEPSQPVTVGPPRVVHDLLALSDRPSLGATDIVSDVATITTAGIPGLIELLRCAERRIPFIVCAAPVEHADPHWTERARRIAHRTRGIATVVTLDETATAAFKTELGPLAVWPGAVRTYLPAPLQTTADGWRHRYVPASVLNSSSGKAAVNRIVYAVAQLSTRRRIPAELQVFSGEEHATADYDKLERLCEDLQLEIDIGQEELAEVQRELARANGHLGRLRQAMEANGQSDLFWGLSQVPSSTNGAPSRPETVQDVSEAVAAAQQHLAEWVSIAPTAARELDGIDTAPSAYAWGNSAWRGLQALAAYAQLKQRGGGGNFWSWCERGDPLSWPATSKRLAMRESETLRNSRQADSRVFDVDPAVGQGQRIYMEAHLKVSEGGGGLAPRIYFYDDTDGATRRVHVGFVGPHFLVPNSKA
ncbi:hypothetical protein EDC02_5610 [Micromonospora sp. Llam0]|uniref:hypothetical protein n=1 Tax=Micromonospora sp. Llam0 TaxID=2485143 RepID=UPI000F47D465|nr:hypothetical protein [Micromonospora sp. Llam0]ROO50757.1 hypothetical protein EDC02_5610 [Micromonospora sp. Llam0]